MDKSELLPYRVGALMYTPALNKGVGENICAGAFPGLDSLALCLEDAIGENGIKDAEAQLVKTLAYIGEHSSDNLPLLFVRVRDCAQFRRLDTLLGDLSSLLTGVIFPKFDLTNAVEYCTLTWKINSGRVVPLYIMPILESSSIMSLNTRKRALLSLRDLLDNYKDYVLNIRVGAMDFCNLYGLRRSIGQTVYDIGVVRNVIVDILTVFADSYVVSAPVCEYFRSSNCDESWAAGLENELQFDIANGFIGKTIIHPSQLPIVKKWLKPTITDIDDAKAVLEWKDGIWGVARSVNGNRMNELATHRKWAQKILILSEIYGVRGF